MSPKPIPQSAELGNHCPCWDPFSNSTAKVRQTQYKVLAVRRCPFRRCPFYSQLSCFGLLGVLFLNVFDGGLSLNSYCRSTTGSTIYPSLTDAYPDGVSLPAFY